MKNKKIEITGGKNIVVSRMRHHSKASEIYVDVTFIYPQRQLQWAVPIEYPRGGLHLADASEKERDDYLIKVYEQCHPSKWPNWHAEQRVFWATKNRADVTRNFFDVLAKDFAWCSTASDFPRNPNPARRIQDLKDFGYMIATDTNRIDKKSGRRCTHHLLLPLTKGGIRGYETWTPETRDRIMSTLRNYDSYEGKLGRKEGLLPDHKFPEIRWDEQTRRASKELQLLTKDDIKRDFQLLNNQRNQQKREVCRRCYQTSKRGYPFGIKYYHIGTEQWPADIPKKGKGAEVGCLGCGWYDLEVWRQSVIKALSED